MKNLLFFASDFKIGLSALLTDQLISIHKSGVNVLAVAGEGQQEDGLDSKLAQSGVRVIRINGLDYHSNYIHLVNELKQLILDNDIDIVHVQNNWQLALMAAIRVRLLFKRKIEVAYTLHGFRHNSPVKSRIAQVVIGSALLGVADHVICMTEYLKRKFSLLSYKIHLIPLGINDDFFKDDFSRPRTDGLYIIFPAQFREGKNQDIIIRAFAKFVKETDDLNSTLTLPGSGHLLSEMQKLADDLGVKGQVMFPGQLSKSEVKQSYLDSNIAVVASNSETFGQSIVEPYVLGRCVVSTPVGIAKEIVRDGESGYIFNNEEELKLCFKNLANNPSSICNIAKHNYKKRKSFSWVCVTEKYIESLGLK